MKKTMIAAALLFSLVSCKTEKKEEPKVETSIVKEKSAIENIKIDDLSLEEATLGMYSFLEENEEVTKESYYVFYTYFRRHYQLKADKSEYNSFANLVKKTLKSEDDTMRNLQYQDLKKELLKYK